MLGTLLADAEDRKPVILRPYQEQMKQAWHAAKDRGVKRGLVVGATGTGKTTSFADIIGEQCLADEDYSAMILAHRSELLRQASERFAGMFPHIGVGIEAGDMQCPTHARVVAASVQSVGSPGCKRLSWMRPKEIICDEGHHGAASSYQNVFRRFGCYDTDGTYLLGYTATPHRLDQLALYGSEEAIFQEVVFTYDIVAAIRDGFLVDLRGYRAAADIDLSKVRRSHGDYNQKELEKIVNVEAVNDLAFSSWQEVASDRQTIVFCSGVEHARTYAHICSEMGIQAEAVYGDMPVAQRDKVINRFRRRETQVITNCDVLTEGFDAQECGCVILLRPTTSWSLFTQMVGRGLRTLPNVIEGIGEPAARREAIESSAKPDCIVIDIVANTTTHRVDDKPESRDIPSLQALVGLPPALDLEGRTVGKALQEFSALPEMVKSAAFHRKTTFSGLSSVLTQVQMLAELELPDEAIHAGSQLFWLKIGDMAYMIDCGSFGHGIERRAVLRGDILGNWILHLESFEGTRQLRDEVFPMPDALDRAFPAAERVIRKSFSGVSRLAGVNSPWRTGLPTVEQVGALREAGMDEAVLKDLDQGKASAMLTMLKGRGVEKFD